MKPVIKPWFRWLLAVWVLAALAPALCAATTGCFSAPANLVGWWPGDGSTNDIAGTNNGTLQGGATATALGIIGSAFSFNGTNGYVQIPDSPSLRPTYLTVEAWVNFSGLDSARLGTAPAGDQYIVFKQNSRMYSFEGYSLEKFRVANGDAFMFTVASTSGQEVVLLSKTLISTSVWYHVAAVRGPDFTELYVNGQLEGHTNVAFAQDYGSNALYFGTSGETYWDGKLRGLLDEVSLYNRALSSNEVAAVYAAGSAGKCKAPGITAQPQSQAVVIGNSAMFTVTATGLGVLSYQWQFKGTNIAGANSPSLTLNNVQPTNAGSYTVVVTNGLGSTTSTAATLTVLCPAITVGPAILPSSLVNIPYSQSLSASGGRGSYTFAVTAGALPAGLELSSAGVLSGTPPAIGTNSFTVTAWDTNACTGTQHCTLAVTGAPPVITLQPQSRTNILGTDASFSVTASGTPPPAYQWQFNGAAIPGATNPTLLRSAVSFADAGGYRVVLTNLAGAVTSAVATLTVVCPSVALSPASLSGGTPGIAYSQSLTASGGQGPYSFAVTAGTLPAGLSLSGAGVLSGTPSAIGTNSFSVTATDTIGCSGSLAFTLAVTGEQPVITLQPQSRTNLSGTDASFIVTASGTQPLSYQWQFNGADISGASGTSLLLTNVQPTNAGSYRVVVTNVAGSATSATVSLTVTLPLQSVNQSAGALVLVNSQSPRYLDFQHFIQPYLDNFGFPYAVQDIATTVPGPAISNCAVIIIGHRQLDTNHIYLNTAAQASLSLAVSNGTGLVSFDSDLYSGIAPNYQFVQDIFGFNYGSGGSGTSASLPPTESSSQMHYITARHPTNDLIRFRSGISLPGITAPAGGRTLVRVGGQPLVTIVNCGQGRAVQWGSYDWMVSTVLGPVDGLDDVVWRGVVWAARKPVVMRGLPNFVTMRVDDVEGPFDWVHAANGVGFKPFLALFISEMSETNAPDLRGLVTNGNATASIHAFTASSLFYFDHLHETNNSDTVQSNNFFAGTQWLINHGIPTSKICATHYSEIGPNCFAGLKAWGMEYVPIEVVPGTVEYATPGAPWLVCGPYRLYEPPQPGQVNWPTYYADWLAVPGHPEFDGQFFNIYSEVRDAASCGEWCPDNDVAGSIGRATTMLRRALDSLVMPTLFSHEWAIHPTSCCGSTTITSNNWQTILNGITNNLSPYNPIYVTLDYASQYVRATRTSRLLSSSFDPGSGQVTATFSGQTDLDTQVYVFVGPDGAITNIVGLVAAFSGSVTNTAATLPTGPMSPTIVIQPGSLTTNAGATVALTVTASGAAPLTYQWLKDFAPLADGDNVSGAGSATLILTDVTGTNAGDYAAVVTNPVGSVTSAVATLTVGLPPAITAQPHSLTNVAGTVATFGVTASGTTPLAYQWQFNGGSIPGATATSLGLSNVRATNAGNYTVVVTNVAGSATSAVATLTVIVPPVITAQPASLGVVAGSNASLSVTATGTQPLSYQWRFNGTDVGGGAGASLPLINVQPANAGNYTVMVTNVAGLVTSTVASVTVIVPPVITAQPVSLSVVAGTNIGFSVAASGTQPLSYRWQFAGTNLSDGGQFSGSAGATLYISNLQATNAGDYRVVISNAAGSATSTVASLTISLPVLCGASAVGLVGWWPGDGSVNDIAGTNNGVLHAGATAAGLGVAGSAFAFDGTNGFVQIPDSPALRSTNLTVEAWVAFSNLNSAVSGTAPSGDQYLVFKQNSLSYDFEGYSLEKFRIGNGDAFMFTVASSSGQEVVLLSKTLISTSVWYHVAAVRGSNFIELYVNGQLEARTNVPFAQDYGNYPLYFGTSGESYWDGRLRGLLDEVSLYNRPLSSNEIAAVYAAGSAGKCKAPGIATQPQSQEVAAGAIALFTVGATGIGSLSYQWQFNGVNIAGATNTSLTLNNVQPTNAGSYTVVVTNTMGSLSSAAAVLRVTARPVILSPHTLPGGSFGFTITGTDGLTYGVEVSTNLRDWTPLTTVTTTGGQASVTDTISYGSVTRFYRAVFLY